MRFTNVLEQAKWHVLSLYGVIILLFLLCLGLTIGWRSTQSEMTIHIPPEIPANGLTLKADSYPSAAIFSFAFYIWQSLNYWPEDGSQDYQTRIHQFSPYLTPKFNQFLQNDFSTRYSGGELQSRTREMEGMNGEALNAQDIKYLGHNTWLVHLTMRLTERMNHDSNRVKDTEIQYVLRVVRYQVDSQKNPWGLALDGFESDPARLATFV